MEQGTMIKNPDFLIIPHQLILDKNLQPLDRILYGAIYWLVRLKNERCSAPNKTLKEICGCKTNRAISNSLENLEKNGYILRRYFDDKKKKRDEIIPLVVFERVGTNDDTVGTNDDTQAGTNDDTWVGTANSLSPLIELFKQVNPSYQKLFANKTQRAALDRLVKQHGFYKIKWAIEVLPKTNRTKYAPTICTPLQLEEKLGNLIAFIQKERSEIAAKKIIKV